MKKLEKKNPEKISVMELITTLLQLVSRFAFSRQQ